MNLGQRVKAARERAGLSQDELAQLADIPRSTLSGIEATDKQPRTSTLASLARALNVSLDSLMDHRAVVVSVQENERSLKDVVTEVSSILDSALSLSAGIRQEAEMRTSEGRVLSQAVTSLGAAVTTSSENWRLVADELISLRREVASLRDRVQQLEQAPQDYARPDLQTSALEIARNRATHCSLEPTGEDASAQQEVGL